MANQQLPLAGLKVIDIATMMAAPWAATYLGDYGADLIKIEHPIKGDAVRNFGEEKNGKGVFWKSLSRNKKCITLNLKEEKGKEIFFKLIKDADVLIENFRPGTMEKWGVGWEELEKINPKLIMLRCSGFGQDGPYAKRGGFGTVAEGISGFASINGYPDSPPTLPPVALADGVTGVFAALAIMIAVHERAGSGKGQSIDICLYEPLMRMLECNIMEYSTLKKIPSRIGNRINSAAPRNVYQAGDGRWVALSGSAQPIAENVFKAIGKPELIDDPRFKDNPSRVKNVDELDDIIGEWIAQRTFKEAVDILLAAGAVAGPVYEVDQMFTDPHLNHRQSLIEVEDEDLGKIQMPGMFAKLSRTPGSVRFTGPDKGAHNKEIYKGLGFTEEEIEQLAEAGVI